jgi:ATP-dependent exoDNAse (exonuclease V) beta subunit
LNRALYPPPGARQAAVRGPKCPPLKSKDSILERPDDRMEDSRTVAPGAHRFDDYSVVWWDPRWLKLGVKPPPGIRRQELIVKEAPRDVVATRRAAYDTWRAARDRARTEGSVPSVAVQTARDCALGISDFRFQISDFGCEVLDLRIGAREHVGGAAFGLLVHGVLAQTAFDAGRDALDRIARVEARVLGLAEADGRAAADAVESLLRHALFDRARAADARGACRRETPVTLTLPDATIVEGIVDLAFEENGAWTVVDYKTDRDAPVAGDHYHRQVALYASAIGQATGKQVRSVIVRL